MNVRRLRVALAEKNWRQYELAEKVGVSQSYISYVMAGRRLVSKELQRKIERALRLKVGTLGNGRK